MDEKIQKADQKNRDNKHYQPQFIATKENREKIKKSFEKSRKDSMKGKYDAIVEV